MEKTEMMERKSLQTQSMNKRQSLLAAEGQKARLGSREGLGTSFALGEKEFLMSSV